MTWLGCSPPSTITATRLRTVHDTFHKVLEKDRELLGAVKKRKRVAAIAQWSVLWPLIVVVVCC